MSSFAEKVVKARVSLGLSQAQLAEKVGVSTRAIQTYEQGVKEPRAKTAYALAKTLQVSTKFLTDENCDDPMEDIDKDGYIEEARAKYGTQGARDVNDLLADNKALFAGGELSDDQKEKFFQAITEAYFACREEAKKKFSNHKN